jgi:catalase-peroxidase
VLGGCAAVEQAARTPATPSRCPFTPGRTDASQEQTDVEGFAVLEPGRRLPQLSPGAFSVPTEELLVDRAQLLS